MKKSLKNGAALLAAVALPFAAVCAGFLGFNYAGMLSEPSVSSNASFSEISYAESPHRHAYTDEPLPAVSGRDDPSDLTELSDPSASSGGTEASAPESGAPEESGTSVREESGASAAPEPSEAPEPSDSSETDSSAVADLTPGEAFDPPSPEDFVPPAPDPNVPYQSLYPGMYTPRADSVRVYDGSLFLTFDDGPSKNTERILGILREQKVKATFFVVTGETMPEWKAELLRKIVADGHTLGVHSATHDFKTIYGSVESYLYDFATASDLIYEATGVRPWVFRFPGGTKNSYNASTYEAIVGEMNRRGFVHYDWNASAQDASNSATPASILENMNSGVLPTKENVLLLHDTKGMTVDLLADYIKAKKAEGYTFSRLTQDVRPVCWY